MIPILDRPHAKRGVGGTVWLRTALLLALACAAFSSQWDRRAAQEALVKARKMREELAGSASPSQERYIRCIRTFQQVYLKDPHYGGSDDAIFEAGELYQEMGERFGTLLYYKNAAKLFRFLIKDYRKSPRCPDALLHLGDLNSGPLEDEQGAQEAYEQLRTRYKSSRAAAALTMKKIPTEDASKHASSRTSQTQQGAAAGTAAVQNIRHWSTSDYTRVIIDMDIQTRYTKTRLANPDRIFFDISNAKLSPELLNKTFVVGDAFLRQVRVGQNRLDVVRVVLDFATIGDYSVFELHDPFRIVVDIHGARANRSVPQQVTESVEVLKEGPEKTAHAAPSKTEERRTEPAVRPSAHLETPPGPKPEKAADVKSASVDKTASKTEKAQDAPAAEEKAPLVVQELPTFAPPAPRGAEQPAASVKLEAARSNKTARPSPPIVGTESLPLPKAAAPTSRGDRTLTRMLGLKIGRIVLDPGHGGHDTGTIGRGGLLEKDLVLLVARDLKSLLSDKLGAEVILTREDDTFISLEERTAIANQSRADLFISIHANSSRSRVVSGVETYYLNFARTDAEREVAARENATSVRNISDLQNLIRKIAQADKSAESRELAAILQTKLYGSARELFPSARNRGVRTAPFVVLIGANMPSVLAEVAFISNPRDEKVLRQNNNRQRLAQALFAGIEGYMKTLGIDVAQSHAGGN